MEDKGEISDGYHTFNELYAHRIELFLALCRSLPHHAWKSKLHADGSKFDGWFILGIFEKLGMQITYHVPLSEWGRANFIEKETAPEFDGHTSQDVLERIKLLWTK